MNARWKRRLTNTKNARERGRVSFDCVLGFLLERDDVDVVVVAVGIFDLFEFLRCLLGVVEGAGGEAKGGEGEGAAAREGGIGEGGKERRGEGESGMECGSGD